MKRYNITNDTKGGIKAVESNTGHWMLAGEVERMLEDMCDDILEDAQNEDWINREDEKEQDNGN